MEIIFQFAGDSVREITNPRKTLRRHAPGDGSEPHPKNKTHFRKAIRKWIRSNFDLVQSIAIVYLNRDYEPPPGGQARLGGSECIVVKDAVLLLDLSAIPYVTKKEITSKNTTKPIQYLKAHFYLSTSKTDTNYRPISSSTSP
ncbi:hypothetical protein CDAR_476101 [Caerostris darwini]|uniref:Uncharacterized protein n=1 Tax=Caerostris darwini TaxID=1538125 RepID=A0AAV4P8S9_9ARAC|nr:hypothetical protein CDAR_476101 [Caerostris darwini]